MEGGGEGDGGGLPAAVEAYFSAGVECLLEGLLGTGGGRSRTYD